CGNHVGRELTSCPSIHPSIASYLYSCPVPLHCLHGLRPLHLSPLSLDRNSHLIFHLQGKRKKSSRQPQGPRKVSVCFLRPRRPLLTLHQREPLPTTFSCLFCNHENSVVVKLDKKLGLGDLSCKVCGQKFQTGINYLSAPVDVYSDWVDACDAVAKDTANQYESGPPRSRAADPPETQNTYDDDDY
ncbi:hypothetical protein N7510_006787, partial [Penicillium lagena]|uniref:uncharacterized protein n=1 Tax=Penicillium lagena TaxID=94218 RepID=UPI002540B18C